MYLRVPRNAPSVDPRIVTANYIRWPQFWRNCHQASEWPRLIYVWGEIDNSLASQALIRSAAYHHNEEDVHLGSIYEHTLGVVSAQLSHIVSLSCVDAWSFRSF